MKIGWQVFWGVLGALLVFSCVLSIPVFMEARNQAREASAGALASSQRAEAMNMKAEVSLLDQQARSSPSPAQQKKIVAQLDALKNRLAFLQKQYGNQPDFAYSDEMIKRLDAWTREWRD